jgi:hypothetical protein
VPDASAMNATARIEVGGKDLNMHLEITLDRSLSFAQSPVPRHLETHVHHCVEWLLRVLRPADDPFFYYMVEQLTADQPEIVRCEVESRVFPLIPISRHETGIHGSAAWTLD